MSSAPFRALAFAGLAVLLSLSTWFSATAIGPELAKDWSLSTCQVGWLTNAVQIGFVIGALTSSILALADIVSLTRLMTAAALLAGLFNAVLLLEPSATVAILARAATGIALSAIYPPAMKFIATWFDKGRGFAMGTMVGALTLGSALPHLLRAAGAGLPWETVVWASSLACFLSALLFAFVLREGPHSFPKARVDLTQIGSVLRNRPVMLANTGYFGHMWELYAMWGWFLAFATAANQSPDLQLRVSFLAFAVVAMGAPGCVLAGLLADRIGRCNTTAVAMTVSGTCAIVIGFVFSGPAWLFVLVALIWGFAIVADSAQFSAAVSELADSSLVGSALAFQMGVGFAITVFVIWLMPFVVYWLGSWQWAFLVLAPGPFIGTWAMLRLRTDAASLRLAEGKR